MLSSFCLHASQWPRSRSVIILYHSAFVFQKVDEKKFRCCLLGYDISSVKMDAAGSTCMTIWRLSLEDQSPNFHPCEDPKSRKVIGTY
jgi:hypothetical protein